LAEGKIAPGVLVCLTRQNRHSLSNAKRLVSASDIGNEKHQYRPQKSLSDKL